MLIPNLKASALRTAVAGPANGMVVSTHKNERGSAVCDRTRGVPDGCSQGDLRLPREPFSPADAEGRIVGRCTEGRIPYAQTHTNTKDIMDGIPLGMSNESVTGEPFGRDVIGPLPMVERPPATEALPLTLAVAEWERCLRSEFCPSRKRHKPFLVDSGAAFVQRKGDSFPCLIPEDSTQDEALRMVLGLNPFERCWAML